MLMNRESFNVVLMYDPGRSLDNIPESPLELFLIPWPQVIFDVMCCEFMVHAEQQHKHVSH
jgi:hypothetical protein